MKRAMVAACLVGLLAGCAALPPSVPPDPPGGGPEGADGSAHADGLAGADVAAAEADPYRPAASRHATGTLLSLGGEAVGAVSVITEDLGPDFDGGPIARVEFLDLRPEYEGLTAGGSIAPRGGDPCFDVGLRSGGGTLQPGVATSMPAEIDGVYIYEIVLHLSWANADRAEELGVTADCLQPVAARAQLEWR